MEMAYPMVCFCDIPLSKLKRHIGTYGNYGIGLAKNWGFKKNLSPVIYTKQKARTASNYEKLIKWYRQNFDEGSKNSKEKKFRQLFSDFLMFTKPYSGKMFKNGKNQFTRFYDEREWRWVPRITNKDIWTHLGKEQFLNKEIKDKADLMVSELYRLHFQPKDINYLILNTEEEIDDFIQSIEQIKEKFNKRTIKKLTSRIITRQQIISDF